MKNSPLCMESHSGELMEKAGLLERNQTNRLLV